MYKAYLDNNIILNIEDGIYSADQFLTMNDYAYYYSQAHIEELLEAKDNPKVSQRGRLNLLSKLCGRNNILTGVIDAPEFSQKEPIEMYHLVDNPLRLYIKQLVNQYDMQALKVRQVLGFDTICFNNEPPENILNLIDARMKKKLNLDLISFLKRTESSGGRAIYQTLLQLIDTANYWGDKKTSHSNVARLYDASHAYFAKVCDVLVTDDKRMRMKVKAIYSFIGVKTIVMSSGEFLCNRH